MVIFFENRDVGIKNLKALTWEQVLGRDYHAWTMDRIVVETAGKSVEEWVSELITKLKAEDSCGY